MSGISTHILDTELGKPASGVNVSLYRRVGERLQMFASAVTDSDGRCRSLLASDAVVPGEYQLRFATAEYFAQSNRQSLYDDVYICFMIREAGDYHLPLLLSSNGYTTYRGS
jgi:5-hydroxyisourate hydrolase